MIDTDSVLGSPCFTHSADSVSARHPGTLLDVNPWALTSASHMKVMAGCPRGGDIRTRGQTGLKLPPVTQLEVAAPGCNQKLCLGKELAFKACLEDPRGHLINILPALEIPGVIVP